MMRKIIFIFILSFSKQLVKAQKAGKISDTSMAVGVILENYTGCAEQVSESCMNNSGKYLNSGDVVVIAGVEQCVYKDDTTDFYKVIFDSTILFVFKEQVKTQNYIYDQLRSFNAKQKSNFERKAKYYAMALWYSDMQKLSNFYKTCQKRGLQLLDWELYDESDYTKGTGIKFSVSNLSKKTIKYISFTVFGINPVGDAVKAKNRLNSIILKGVGPIEQDRAATFKFDYTWFSDLPESAEIKSIKVQFMDNSIVIINPKEIMMSKELKKISEKLSG